MRKQMRWRDAAEQVLARAKGPLHYREITERILADGLRKSNSETPSVTLYSALFADMHKNPQSVFERVAKGLFVLKKRPKATGRHGKSATEKDADSRKGGGSQRNATQESSSSHRR